jgi:hypothetical protein
MPSTKIKVNKMKVPKPSKAAAKKAPMAAREGGLAKGSLASDLKKLQKQAKPKAGKPVKAFGG